MSLDLYIKSDKPILKTGTGIYIRENGKNRELKTKEEVFRYFGNDTNVEIMTYETNEVWHGNMTHNLGKMAKLIKGDKRDLYTLFWRPTEKIVTKDWVDEVLKCYIYLKDHEDKLKPLEEENRVYENNGDSYIWGTFDSLKEFMESLIKCILDLPYESEKYILESDV